MIINKKKTTRIDVRFVEGRGKAKHSLKDAFKEIADRFEINIFPGSLNLVAKTPIFLKRSLCFYVSDDCERFFWKAKLNEKDVLIYRWKECPAHIFEIISELELKDEVQKKDNNILITDNESIYNNYSIFWEKLIWRLFWKYREASYYKDSGYFYILRRFPIVKNVTKRFGFRGIL